MKRVYCLYRVSTKGQVDHDDIPMQKQACRGYAEKMGWTICKEFYEKGISGFKVSANDRDAIQDLKVAAEKKEFDILLVFMFDRLGRIPNETPFVLEWFVKSGIEVWSTKEGQQTFESDCDYLLNYIRFWQAGGESRKTSMRVKTRLGQLVEEGKFTGGAAMFGYRYVKSGVVNKKGKELTELEIVPEEAAIVQMIFMKTVNEGYGTWRLCNLINAQGIKTHNGAKFQSNTVNRILRNYTYTGYYRKGGKKSCFLEHLKIIDEDIYEEAQKILEARNIVNCRKSNIAYTTRGASLLSGNIYCAHCGCRMHAVSYQDPVILADGTKKTYRSIKYICPNRARNRGKCDGQSQYAAHKVDEVVLAVLHGLLKEIHVSERDSTIQERYEVELKKKKAVYVSLQKQYEKEQAKMARLVAEVGNVLVGDSSFDLETINKSIQQSKEALNEYERKIPLALKDLNDKKGVLATLDHFYDEFRGWVDTFDSATQEEKKMILCRLFDRIIIGRDYHIEFVLNVEYGRFVS